MPENEILPEDWLFGAPGVTLEQLSTHVKPAFKNLQNSPFRIEENNSVTVTRNILMEGDVDLNADLDVGGWVKAGEFIQLMPVTATFASALSVQNIFVVVSNTNGTFTSTGLWYRDGATWKKVAFAV